MFLLCCGTISYAHVLFNAIDVGFCPVNFNTARYVPLENVLSAFSFIEKIGYVNSRTLPSVDFSINRVGFNPTINLRNVEFFYSSEEPFRLQIPELIIESGETVAIVGKSGSGKSTLIDLILGMNSPTNGEISISGMNPNKAITTWPGAISFVPQRYQLFNGTLRDNLCLGFDKGQVDDDSVYEALAKAQLLDLIPELPLGLDEPLGENGLTLSGGQRQRICIARALLTKPEVLVLDEATSSLDNETEFEIMQVLNQLKGTLTLIIVAHRLSTIKNCNKILFMRNGKIESSGTFDELRLSNPFFDRQAELAGY